MTKAEWLFDDGNEPCLSVIDDETANETMRGITDNTLESPYKPLRVGVAIENAMADRDKPVKKQNPKTELISKA